jgi:hypothetical protein
MRQELVVRVGGMVVLSVESQGLRGENRLDAVGPDVVVGESELVHAEIGVNAPEIGVVCSEIEVFTFEIGGVSAHRGVVRGEIGVISAKKCPTTCHPDRSDGRHVLSSRAKARSAAVEGSARRRGRNADPSAPPHCVRGWSG